MAIPPRRWVGYALLVAGLLLLYDTYTFLTTNWSPLRIPLDVPTELALGYLLIAAAIVAFLTPILIRMIRGFTPNEYPSVEERRRRRLPLRKKFSALPDRAVVGGALMLLLLPAMFLMILPMTPKGLYVRLVPRHDWRPNENCLQGPIVVSVNWHNGSSQMFLNGKEITRDELARALKAELARRENWEVFVEGDDNVSYSDPMYAIDVINSLHARAVLLTPKLKQQIAAAGCAH